MRVPIRAVMTRTGEARRPSAARCFNAAKYGAWRHAPGTPGSTNAVICPPSPVTITSFDFSGFQSGPSSFSVIQSQKNVRQPVGRVAWMAQPPLRTTCGHHSPGGLLNSATAMSLQQSVQVPHARPGTTR